MFAFSFSITGFISEKYMISCNSESIEEPVVNPTVQVVHISSILVHVCKVKHKNYNTPIY